jgi:hypothetical protein
MDPKMCTNPGKIPGNSREFVHISGVFRFPKIKSDGVFRETSKKSHNSRDFPGFSGISGYFLGFPEFFLKGQKGRGFSLKRKKPTKKGPT